MMFEKATRLKLRFPTPQGIVSVEDLWDLPLSSKANKANLDDIARGLHKQLKSGDDISFVVEDKAADETVKFAFDLVLHVINVRKGENKAASEAKERAEKKQHLLSLLANKENEKLAAMSVDEIRALLEKL